MMQTCNLFHNFLYLLALAVSLYFILFYFINFASQAGRAPQQLAPITQWPLFYPPNHDTQQKTDHNTGNYVPYS